MIDHTQSRRLLVIVQLILGLQAAVMAALILAHQIEFWHIVVLASILGIVSAVDFPTRTAIVSELLDPALVGNGIASNSAARLVGPGVGGVMLAAWGSGAEGFGALNMAMGVGSTLARVVLRHTRARRQKECTRAG